MLNGCFHFYSVAINSILFKVGCNMDMDCILPHDEFEFRPGRLLTIELAALECLKIRCLHFFSVANDPIIFNLQVTKRDAFLLVLQRHSLVLVEF